MDLNLPRYAAVAAHLRERDGDVVTAARLYIEAARAATNLAERDGDQEIVEDVDRLIAGGTTPLVVTADRGLRDRLPGTARVTGPGWLLAAADAAPQR